METAAAHIPAAAAGFTQVTAALSTAQLAAPTPCDGYDVRALLNHVLYWSPVLEAAAGDTAPAGGTPRSPAGEREADLVGEDWRERLGTRVRALAQAWARPEAWQGTGRWVTGELPSTLIGTMTLVDLTVHGWDLARAAGLDYAVPEELAAALWRAAVAIGQQGRSGGAFGTEVAVARDAPPFERALGAFGRDPEWAP